MISLVSAVEDFYHDKTLPLNVERLLAEICVSAAQGETPIGIARRLHVDVKEVAEVVRRDGELADIDY
ncbi:MAG: hypothetical protein V3V31_03720 [Methylococcales bacterium]